MEALKERPRVAETTGGTTPKVRLSMLFNTTLPLRFWSKVYADEYGCWLWTGSTDGDGYSTASFQRIFRGHRITYSVFKGAIPDGLDIDHLCRVRCCVNPRHLEAVTRSVNMLRGDLPNQRKTHCPQGHPYTYRRADGSRSCRLCVYGKGVARNRKKIGLSK